MILDESSAGKKRYFHPDCHEKWKNLDKELEQQDQLNTTIKRIHGIPAVHSQLWQWIQDVRMGNIRKGAKVVKHYREGIPYPVIEQAYVLAERDIAWARANKSGEFNKSKDEKLAELKYCFAIVKDKIALAYHRWQKAEKARLGVKMEEEMKQDESFSPPVDNAPLVFKKRENKNDISAFLD
jgi:hypothetical protein